MDGRSFVWMASALLLFSPLEVRATEPDAAAINCLTSVLHAAANSISVKPAPDWGDDVAMKPHTKKGVVFTFRGADGTVRTVGVFLGTEYSMKYSGAGTMRSMSGYPVPDDNGRFSLMLRPPYPTEWARSARTVVEGNSTRYIPVLSKTNPLYGLWERLSAQCGIDNGDPSWPVAP